MDNHENDGAVENAGTPVPEPSFFDKKDARQVIWRILSTNFAIMAGGMNGTILSSCLPLSVHQTGVRVLIE